MLNGVVTPWPDSRPDKTDIGPTVGIGEAAEALGISVEGVRKRIKRGQLTAIKVGDVWRIVLSSSVRPTVGALSAGQSGPTAVGQLSGRQDPTTLSGPPVGRTSPDTSGQPPQLPAEAPGEALRLAESLAGQLAAERERSAALEQERAELYGRLGYFHAQLEQARTKLALLEGPKP